MSDPSETNARAEEIRSDIDSTRERMNQTIDALGERLKGRHLVDEVIGYFRTDAGQQGLNTVKEKITSSTSSAFTAVADTVKANPIPLLLIGAGVGWMIYQNRKSRADSQYSESPYEREMSDEAGFEASGGGYQSEYWEGDYGSELSEAGAAAADTAAGLADKAKAAGERLRDKAMQAKDSLQNKAGEVGQKLKDGAQSLRERAGEMGERLQESGRQVADRSRELYQRSRERVVTTAQEHPLEIGLGLLALGIAAGLALPTPRKVHEVVGPRADQLRERARQAGQDLVKRGRHVVEAAAEAARNEAKSQGITPDALKGKAQAVAERAKDAAADTARNEGLAPAGASAGNPPPVS